MSKNIEKKSDGEVKAIYTMCAAHCGGDCLIKCYVKDGVLLKVETDDGIQPQVRGCLKGTSRPTVCVFP